MVQSMNDNNPLSGLSVLVVEDDLLLAMDSENLALLQRRCPAHLQNKLQLLFSASF